MDISEETNESNELLEGNQEADSRCNWDIEILQFVVDSFICMFPDHDGSGKKRTDKDSRGNIVAALVVWFFAAGICSWAMSMPKLTTISQRFILYYENRSNSIQGQQYNISSAEFFHSVFNQQLITKAAALLSRRKSTTNTAEPSWSEFCMVEAT